MEEIRAKCQSLLSANKDSLDFWVEGLGKDEVIPPAENFSDYEIILLRTYVDSIGPNNASSDEEPPLMAELAPEEDDQESSDEDDDYIDRDDCRRDARIRPARTLVLPLDPSPILLEAYSRLENSVEFNSMLTYQGQILAAYEELRCMEPVIPYSAIDVLSDVSKGTIMKVIDCILYCNRKQVGRL